MPNSLDALYRRRIPFGTILTFACAAITLAGASAVAQSQQPPSAQTGAAETGPPESSASETSTAGAFTVIDIHGELKEDQLRQLLVGKSFYLRGAYQDNNLDFDSDGRLLSHSPRGSYTLGQIQIIKVKLGKRRVELEGDRYALHFLGAAPFEDPAAATDRVKITPRKKLVRIWIEREEVEKPKKEKNKDREHNRQAKNKDGREEALRLQTRRPDAPNDPMQPAKHGDKRKATSAIQATDQLLTALDAILAPGIDERMIAAMPPFWKLYYQAAKSRASFKPAEPGVYRQNDVDQKARLISVLDPPSNELAQKSGIAGIALYHAVVGSDGKVSEVVAGRPIGFGLDENAEQAIRKAIFQPAMKSGQPVPVLLDLVVSFRIYSKRTSQPAAPEQATEQKPQPILPGPYTLEELRAQAAAQMKTPAPAAPPQSQP